jgi:hypothetical protein
VLYNWDLWLLDKDTPGFELQSHGVKELATAPQCRDGSCVPFTNGTYLQLPAHNFGQYAGLTFALWFKPTSASGSDAPIVDFGRGADQDNIVIARKGATSDLLLSVRVTAQDTFASCEGTGMWEPGVWRHVVWTLGFNRNVVVWQVVCVLECMCVCASVVLFFRVGMCLLFLCIDCTECAFVSACSGFMYAGTFCGRFTHRCVHVCTRSAPAANTSCAARQFEEHANPSTYVCTQIHPKQSFASLKRPPRTAAFVRYLSSRKQKKQRVNITSSSSFPPKSKSSPGQLPPILMRQYWREG